MSTATADHMITKANAGDRVSVRVGATISISLEYNVSTGGSWTITALPAFLKEAGFEVVEPKASAPAVSSPYPVPPNAGGPSTGVWSFEVIAEGEGNLKMVLRGPGRNAPTWVEIDVAVIATS